MLGKKPHIKFDKRGLVPVVVQHIETQEVIHLVYMDRKALKKTQQTGKLYLFNRSQKKVWMKGQRSGATFDVQKIFSHVDKYALLVQGIPNGPNCQTGQDSCFTFPYWEKGQQEGGDSEVLDAFRQIFSDKNQQEEPEDFRPANTNQEPEEPAENLSVDEIAVEMRSTDQSSNEPAVPPEGPSESTHSLPPDKGKDILAEWYWHLAESIDLPETDSTSPPLENKHIREISRKLGQDVIDLTTAAFDKNKVSLVKESADMIQHWLFMLASQGITLADLYDELEDRLASDFRLRI